MKPKTHGRVTLPAEAGLEKEIKELCEILGADAVRDSDGTTLSKEIMNMGYTVYRTLCLVREDLDWTKEHRQYLQQIYLMSNPKMAASDTLEIDIMEGKSKEQFSPDSKEGYKKYWDVINRTTGEVVDPANWDYSPGTGTVTIKNTTPNHIYTVNFLAHQLWDMTSMYNHIVNNWTGEHKMPLDPIHPEAKEHMLNYLENWLKDNPETDIVRFTTFAYHFPIINDPSGRRAFGDWYSYLATVSRKALDDFEKEKGYRLSSEDFVDEGYYNNIGRVPSKRYLEWADFMQRRVFAFAKECVDIVHKHGKKAIMFFGDHWIGTEPYGPYFKELNLDGVVGSVEDGTWLRLTADIPGGGFREVRFLPYFFPDVFREGGNPVKESIDAWVKVRRAILRKCVDRIGYGGYPDLALKFPNFIKHIAEVCDEFRLIHDKIGGTKPYTPPFKVAVLTAWGRLRSWQGYSPETAGLLEILSGLPFEVEFINFDDIKKGLDKDIKVIINAGKEGTSWSGGNNWADPQIQSKIREFVADGGGFIGIYEPTALERQGSFFQLSDVLGLQKENGFTTTYVKPKANAANGHFILEDLKDNPYYFNRARNVYPTSPATEILLEEYGEVVLAANQYDKGRSVYFAALDFTPHNTRLLHRAILWAAGMEKDLTRWFTTNVHTDCAAYPATGNFAVINNSGEPQETTVYNDKGQSKVISLAPFEGKWFNVSEF